MTVSSAPNLFLSEVNGLQQENCDVRTKNYQ